MTKECITCNKLIVKAPSTSMYSWKFRKKYCSIICKNPPRACLSCLNCSKKFIVKNYRKNTAHFCSQICSYKFRDEGKRTEHKKIRQSWAYKKWRESVFLRDGYTCRMCGDKNRKGRESSVALHADHIKPFSLYPELRFSTENGRTLCVPCHKSTGTYGRGAVYRSTKILNQG